jgi:hypothetical protein
MRTLKQFNLTSELAIIIYLSAFKLLLHFLTNGQYGYFRAPLWLYARPLSASA